MIPIIKFSALQADVLGAIDNLHDACLNWGLFYLEDTPVSPAARASVFERSKQFFDLSSDRKRSLDIKHSENFRGYVGPGEETTNGLPDLKESLEFAQESLTLPDTPRAPFFQLFGTNQWPDESWLPGFKEDITAYFQQMETLGHKLVDSLARSLGISADERDLYYHELLHYRTRMMSYESLIDLPPDELRIQEHTDMALFNLLLLNRPGLEVKSADGEWHQVLPRKDAFVVILGELSQIWTNGTYRAGVHRVRNSAINEQRISVPFFFYPNLLSPIKTVKNVSEANGEGALLAGEMLWNRLNAVH